MKYIVPPRGEKYAKLGVKPFFIGFLFGVFLAELIRFFPQAFANAPFSDFQTTFYLIIYGFLGGVIGIWISSHVRPNVRH
jgi:hypothetical protein